MKERTGTSAIGMCCYSNNDNNSNNNTNMIIIFKIRYCVPPPNPIRRIRSFPI